MNLYLELIPGGRLNFSLESSFSGAYQLFYLGL